jgi:alkylhydroperoxidase/carboxymuconolactone decarboxylase family protein YurZ
MKNLQEYNEFRKEMNERILNAAPGPEAFLRSTAGYTRRALDEKTLELLRVNNEHGSRCDDCVTYHLVRSYSSAQPIRSSTTRLTCAL